MKEIDLMSDLKRQVKQAISSPDMSVLPDVSYGGALQEGLPVRYGAVLEQKGRVSSIPIDWNRVVKFFRDPRATPGFVAWATDLLLRAINSHIAMERYRGIVQAQQMAKEAAYLNALLGRYSDLSKAYTSGIEALKMMPDSPLKAAAAQRLHNIGMALDLLGNQIMSLYGGKGVALPLPSQEGQISSGQALQSGKSSKGVQGQSWLGGLIDTFTGGVALPDMSGYEDYLD